MKLGAQVAFNETVPASYVGDCGGVIEELGFDSIWVPEHVVFFDAYESRYPYTEEGKIRGDPKGLIDPFMALTFLAARTQRVRLGTGICLVPQRNPVYCAKQVADLDYLSGGRFDFGIGIGWLREEFDALGVPWENRAGRTEECLAVMRTLWCDELSSHQGDRFAFEGVYQNPKPVQKPHPPLIFGGESDAALSRVARLGQGWFGFNHTPETLERCLEKLGGYCEEAGRTVKDLQIFTSPHRDAMDRASTERFAALGVDQLILGLFARDTRKLAERGAALLDNFG